jgi:filamentous hemagglutinin
MDVRQFVFQVRQPPAALSAERFWGMPKRGLAFLLANAMFWQPLWVQANGIVINAPGTGLEHAGNGVPIVNIAAPNASGLSHNQFRDYNVGSEGVILNNATGRTQATQLGGIILGNPNLGGRAASTILNEVNGGNPSQLRGYTEVAGQSARVIVANPYGISCNGCGFINTPRVTLTTGKPVFNNGQLDHYKVDGGSVFIDGAGLNATNVDSFEIITRSAKINAEIHANKLSIVAGRNDVDAQSLNAVARTNDGSAKPELAIDSSALGGMYSGAIKLVATEAGVGVRLAGNLAASGGDIQIDANGNLSLAQAASTHAINIKAASLDAQGPVYAGSTLDVQTSGALSNQRSLAAGDRISLSSGGQLSNNGIIEAGANADNSRNARGDISLSAQNLRNTGTVVASRNLDAHVSQTFDNSGGLIGSAGLLTATAANLVNRLGSLSSGGRLSFTSSGGIDNQGGRLVTDASLDLRSASLDNRQQGSISGKDSVQVNTGTFDNSQGGRLNSGANLNLTAAQLNNNSGTLSGSAFAIDFGSATGDLNNAGGLITTAGQLSIRHLRDLNNAAGEISSHQSYTLAGRTLDNHAGKLISNQQLSLDASSILNQNGLISGWEGLSVTTVNLDNRNHGTLSSRNGDVAVNVSGDLLNSGAGALVSQQHLTVNAGSLDNSSGGILSSAGDQALTVQGLLNNTQGGLIDSGGALTLQTMALDNTYGAVSARRAVSFTGTALDNSHGNLIGNAAVTLNLLGVLTNSNGKLASTGPLLLRHASQVNNQGGQLASRGLMTLLIGGLDNRNGGTVAANDHFILTASGAVQNSDDGLIYSQHGDLRLHAASLANSQGTLQSQREMNLQVIGDIDNLKGRIIAQSGDLNLTAANVDNRGGVLSSLLATLTGFLGGWLKNGYDLLNHKGGNTQAEHLNLTALGGIDNQGGRLAAQSGDAVINTAYLDNREGGLYAAHAVGVTGGALDNSAGQIAAQQIDLSLAGALSNRQGIIESNNILTLNTASIDNQFGQLRTLGTSGASRFLIGGLFDNRNGTLESANTDLHLAAGNFMNTGGTVLHVGSGSFDIATANVLHAGGSLVTRGGLTLNADSWTNTGIIQAGRLTLNVNNFAQTATGQLLASNNLYATGVNWSNDGLIASDGDLYLGLSGAYNGTGRLTSRSDLNLQAGQLTLDESASIASGGDGLINVAGLLSNRGRLTSAGDLMVHAGNLNNHGTLGSGQDLTLTTNALLNDHGLIFSGWDMGLRVASLINSYASIYSLGDLDIDRDGKGGWAASIINSSGLIQGDGSISLAASTIQNIRALLTISDDGIYTAKIEQIQCIEGVNAGDCGGKQNRVWEITQRDKLEVSAASAASSITADGNLNINGGDLLNHSSTIATSGNFTATLNNLTNTGVETSDTETVRVFRTERASNGSGWSNAADEFTEHYWLENSGYDVNNLSGLVEAMSRFIGTTEAELPEFGRTTQLATGDQTYAAIIQAAGNVSIRTQNNFDNSVVRGGFDYVGSGPRTNTDAPGSDFSTRITLNQQLPPDLAQQQVNPLTMPGFELPVGQNGLFRLSGQGGSTTDNGPEGWSVGGSGVSSIRKVQGLPSSHGTSNPHKYLIETNPALTDLKQFMGSDYLLGKLGYNPDDSAKRLGDGFYEQKLIQQAVVARTGQRFIDGLTSDQAMFRYLMDNAIASKDELNLSLGVTLSAEQVAALTHDIVWMETATVNGENVLVPVLYLANSNNRLAANGALIQGQDVSLIAGKDLKNAGTLKASETLAALAGNNLLNSGLVNAGNRLDLLASNDLSNKAGGIIAGRDVSLTSISGDVINERTVTGYASGNGHNNQHRDFIDNAVRIEAANDLTISAGRDVNNIGGVLQSGRDTRISAGRDVTIGSAEQVNSNEHGSNNRDLTIRQNGSSLDTGRDLSISAGRDLSAIASQIDAGRDIALDAGKNLTLASAADEEHSYSKTKKVEAQEDHVSQIGTNLNAGGSVVLTAGQDLTLISSKVSAGDEAYLVAGGDLSILAAQDSHYSLYDKEKKGGWGSKETQRDEVTDVKHIASDIKTGGDLTLVSGGDQLYQGAKLESGKDIILDSGGSITFEAVKDLHQESHEKSKGDLAWQSSSGKGNTDETLRQSELVAQGQLVIKAADGLRIDLKHIDQKSVSQTIDAMVQAVPNLAWLKAAEQRGDVDWQLVKEIHDAYDYSSSGLGAGAQLVIAIVMAAFVGPAALAALGGAGAVAAGGAAIATGAATTATVSVINNGGNLGAVLKDVTSSDALKGYAISGLTAGMTAGYFNNWTGTTTDPVTGKISTNLGTWKGVGQFAASQGLQNGTSAALGKIMGQGGDLGDALQSTLFNTLAAASFNAVGDYTKDVYADGSLQKIMIHAMVGGLLAEVSGGDFKTGALAAGANEALVDQLNTWVDGDKNLLNMTSQLVGMLAAATQSGADAESLQTGAWVAQNATQYNFFDHLPPGMSEYGQAATSLTEYMQGQGATAEDITQAQLALAQGQGFDGVQPANEFVKAWGMFMAGELAGVGVGAAIGLKGVVSVTNAVADTRKFSGYIFKPGADHGKDAVFKSLGYTADDSAALSKVWQQQAAKKYAQGEFKLGKADQYGQRVDIEIALPGKGLEAGKISYLRSGWMIQADGSLKLNTPFSGFTRSQK